MTANQSNQREEEIFERALDIESSEERLGYVKGACADDAALLARVRALVQAHDQASRFLPDDPPGAATVLGSTMEQAGTLIGRYKLLEKIGEGGFGAVYVAEQLEPVRLKFNADGTILEHCFCHISREHGKP
jgi:eukaryotic-like serine/threonine-protein kinase